MDLSHFTVMPAGLDDWDRIWPRRDGIPVSRRRVCSRSCGSCSGTRSMSFARSRGSRSGGGSPGRGSISACRRGCFRSGCGARGATGWRRSARSSTATPIRSGRTRRCSSTSPATAAGARSPRGASAAARACRLATCWSALLGTSTSSPTSCGCTVVRRARRVSTCRCSPWTTGPLARAPARSSRASRAGRRGG